jgi:hypothetical protein
MEFLNESDKNFSRCTFFILRAESDLIIHAINIVNHFAAGKCRAHIIIRVSIC